MKDHELYAQADALKQTAKTMINAGNTGTAAHTARHAAKALVEAAQQLKPDNPVIASLTVQLGINLGPHQ
jgi:hypothetical protein